MPVCIFLFSGGTVLLTKKLVDVNKQNLSRLCGRRRLVVAAP